MCMYKAEKKEEKKKKLKEKCDCRLWFYASNVLVPMVTLVLFTQVLVPHVVLTGLTVVSGP